MARKLAKLIQQSVQERPLNKSFLNDLMVAVEKWDIKNRKESSLSYKPSSMVCKRQMCYMRSGEVADDTRSEYNAIGMADTGTRRHVAIQEVLEKMEELGFDWRYIDVAKYLKKKQKKGKCKSLEVVGQKGAETKLYDNSLHVSFMCDGIVEQISTGDFYLFEFKNQASFKYNKKASTKRIDEAHVDQVTAYCMLLDLNKAFVVYENRDLCSLDCPEIFEVTDDMKQQCVDKLVECEHYIEKGIVPPKHENNSPCRWCKYKTACERDG